MAIYLNLVLNINKFTTLSMREIIYMLICVCLFCACQSEKNYFNGETYTINLPFAVDTLDGKELHFDEVQTGEMFVYDSLLFFSSSKYPSYSVSIFNVKSGKHLANCFNRGQGPYEFHNLSFIRYVTYEDNRPHLYAYAVNEQQLIDIDIMAFLKKLTQTGNVDYSAVQVDECLWSTYHTVPFNYQYPLNKRFLLVKTSFESPFMNEEEPMLPTYELIDTKKKEVTRSYSIYQTPIKNDNLQDKSLVYLSTDAIRPDGKQIAMAMGVMPQLIITNMETGEMTCHEIANMLKQKIEKATEENIYLYYKSTVADERHIYSLFVNKPFFQKAGEKLPQGNEIHVFDWNGNLLTRWYIRHAADEIRLDYKGKLLYAKNNITDQIHVYHLK